MTIKFREHRGAYEESMKTVREFSTFLELCKELRSMTKGGIRIVPYDGTTDPRNGWSTHIVTADGAGVIGFTDGTGDYPNSIG